MRNSPSLCCFFFKVCVQLEQSETMKHHHTWQDSTSKVYRQPYNGQDFQRPQNYYLKSLTEAFECKLETLLILIKNMQLCKASFKCKSTLKADTTCYFSLTHMIVQTVIWINAFESYSPGSQKSNRQQALASFREHNKVSTVQP